MIDGRTLCFSGATEEIAPSDFNADHQHTQAPLGTRSRDAQEDALLRHAARLQHQEDAKSAAQEQLRCDHDAAVQLQHATRTVAQDRLEQIQKDEHKAKRDLAKAQTRVEKQGKELKTLQSEFDSASARREQLEEELLRDEEQALQTHLGASSLPAEWVRFGLRVWTTGPE